MALGFYRARYLGIDYLFHGLKDGFKSGYRSDPYLSMFEIGKSHEEFEIEDRTLLIPYELLTFNTETETEND